MAEPSNLKRRKIAETTLKVLLYVAEDDAHRVGTKKFVKLNEKVASILDFAKNQILNETDKFLEAQEPLKLHAITEPNNWCQLRADKHQEPLSCMQRGGKHMEDEVQAQVGANDSG